MIGEVTDDGLLPDEEVAVAVVVAHQVASTDGTARLRLPPALLESHPGLVVFVGKRSGTVMVSGGVRHKPSRSGSRRRPRQPRPRPHRRREPGCRLPEARAGSGAAWVTGASQPAGGWGAGFRVLAHPGDPASALGLTACRPGRTGLCCLHDHGGRRQCPRVVARSGPCGTDLARPTSTCLCRDRTRRTRRRVTEGPARSRSDTAAFPGPARAVRRRLPARALPRPGGLGIGRGLDPAAGTAALRQGTARRHQRNPRRAGSGHHDRDAARQHRRHPTPSGAWSGRRLRSTTPRRGATCWSSLVSRAWLRGPADRDDPSDRPRLGHRVLDRGC